MPIELTPIDHAPLMHGYTWKVANEQLLAELIARVALGQARHVSKILLNIGTPFPDPADGVWSSAVAMFAVSAGDEHSSHRDGWMFQVMSWLAAQNAKPNSQINAPQMIRALKGFDGLQLDFDANGRISAVVIFEDKATINPRETIQKDVFPEFQKFEAGTYMNVLVAEVTSLLEKRPGIDADDVVRHIIWNDARHFRVTITVGDSHSTDAGRRRLFKDYDSIAPGANVGRRRGETFYVADLRAWMDGLANKCLAHIAAVKAASV